MPIVALFEASDHTQQQYDQILKELEARGFAAPDGRLFHVAWNSPKGWHVLDVWESEEKLGKFAQIMKPIIAEVGASPSQPKVFAAHNIIKG